MGSVLARKFYLPFQLVLVALAFAVLSSVAQPAIASDDAADRRKKVALVIGLGAYPKSEPLLNTAADARLIAERMKQAGFEVAELFDANEDGLRAALTKFYATAAGADIALTYFAGHSVQIDGENYFVPVDFDPAALDPIKSLVSATAHLKQVATIARAQVLLLDACRDNPFARTLARNLSGKSVAAGVGAIEMPVVERNASNATVAGLLVGYATQPGTTADDGAGKNGPYALALSEAMARSDESFASILQRAAALVSTTTGGMQHPEQRDALTAPIYLVLRPKPLACDLLAAEKDNNVSVRGVEFDDIDVAQALPACQADIARFPGNARLRHNLARVLDRKGDDQEAVSLYRQAAEAGYDWSQNNLGAMLIMGEGIPRDIREGLVWTKRAMAQGNRQAIVTYRELDLEDLFARAPHRTSALQTALAEKSGTAVAGTGALDPSTLTAIEAFRNAKKLAGSGITFELIDALGIADDVFKREAR